jgi:hypothetical protein
MCPTFPAHQLTELIVLTILSEDFKSESSSLCNILQWHYDILALMMETVCFSETLVSTYESTWHHNTEKQCHHLMNSVHNGLPSLLKIHC